MITNMLLLSAASALVRYRVRLGFKAVCCDSSCLFVIRWRDLLSVDISSFDLSRTKLWSLQIESANLSIILIVNCVIFDLTSRYCPFVVGQSGNMALSH